MLRTPDHVCPRCLGYIPNNHHKGEYPGALSRKDNATEVCSECGVEEAFLAASKGLYREGYEEEWPIDSPRRMVDVPTK